MVVKAPLLRMLLLFVLVLVLLLAAAPVVQAQSGDPGEGGIVIPDFDFFQFFFVSVGGLPLSLLILLLVQWVKKAFEITGRWVFIISMLIGLVFGIPYQFLIAVVPDTPAGIFTAICYGIGLGLLASGVYTVVEQTAKRAAEKVVG